MYTVVETRDFQKQAAAIWNELERTDFITWIAANPLVGDVIPGTNGARKVRWSRSGMGKQGGARVIYFHLNAAGILVLVAVYTKSEQANIAPHTISKGQTYEY